MRPARPGARRVAGTLLALLVLPALAGPVHASDRETPGEILVLRRSPDGLGAAAAAFPLAERARDLGLRVRETRALVPDASGFAGRAWLVRLEPGEDASAAAARLSADPDIAWAGPNRWIALEEPTDPGTPPVPVLTTPAYRPNDPLFDEQTGLIQAGFVDSWGSNAGAGIVVAILDTGVQLDHPDLVGQFAVNEAEANGLPGVDDDGNGYVDDVTGYDFTDVPGLPGLGDAYDRDPDPTDDVGHGTAVAGVVAAIRDNRLGIAGAASDARILPVRCGFRVDNPFVAGGLQEDDIAAGIVYAADNGANILNLSFGDVVDAPVIREAIRYARERGCLVVASAGNDADDAAHYPAGYPGVVSAGASSGEARAIFSVFGDDLDLLAPGVAVWTTQLDGEYGPINGTSFSAPFVASAAALVWARYPTWTAEEVASVVRFACRRDAAGWTPEWGWGHLDVPQALYYAVRQGRPPITLVNDITRDGQTFQVHGSVAGPGLVDWTLDVEIRGTTARIAEGTTPRLDEVLGTWTAPGGPVGEAVFVLRARHAGWPTVETRHRQEAGDSVAQVLGFAMEPQVGDDGWDVVCWFRTDRPMHASGVLTRGSVSVVATEAAAGENHALRFPGPLGDGEWTLTVSGRESRDVVPAELLTRTVQVLFAPGVSGVYQHAARIPGEPMRHPADLDGDGYAEFVLESPPVGGTYGAVRIVEIAPDLADRVREVWDAPYAGIPVAAGDGDGDGRQELVVFRLGGWTVFEQPPGGGYPTANIFAGEPGSLPIGFAEGPGGRVLLATYEGQLRVYRPEGGTYVPWVAVAGTDRDFLPGGVVFDGEGNGGVLVALVDTRGDLVVFRLLADGAGFLGDVPASGTSALTGELAVVPGTGGEEIVALEADPAVPEVEGDFLRSTTRIVRFGIGSGGVERLEGSTAFAGAPGSAPTRLLVAGSDLFRSSPSRLDRVAVADLTWVDRYSTPPGVNTVVPGARGAALLDTGSGILLWRGSRDTGTPVLYEFQVDPDVDWLPSPIRVIEATPVGPDSLRLVLRRELDSCDAAGSWLRWPNVPLGSGLVATDTVARRGSPYIYQWLPIGFTCGASDLLVLVTDPPTVIAEHEGRDRVRLTFDQPVLGEGATVELLVGGEFLPPAAWGLDRDGTGLWATAPGGAGGAYGVRLLGFRSAESALPVGGREELLLPMEGPPPANDPPRILAMRPRSVPAGMELEVEVAGLAPCSDMSWRFVVEAEGISLTGTETGGTVILSLAQPLPAGGYRLTLDPVCADPTAPGAARDFAVGLLLFPNPVTGGTDLIAANVPSDAVIEMVTAEGQRVREIDAGAGGDRVVVSTAGLAPGLYLVRVRTPGGAGDWQRIAILR